MYYLMNLLAKEVEYVVKSLELGKSSGVDNIPNEVLKNDKIKLYWNYVIYFLCFLLNVLFW